MSRHSVRNKPVDHRQAAGAAPCTVRVADTDVVVAAVAQDRVWSDAGTGADRGDIGVDDKTRGCVGATVSDPVDSVVRVVEGCVGGSYSGDSNDVSCSDGGSGLVLGGAHTDRYSGGPGGGGGHDDGHNGCDGGTGGATGGFPAGYGVFVDDSKGGKVYSPSVEIECQKERPVTTNTPSEKTTIKTINADPITTGGSCSGTCFGTSAYGSALWAAKCSLTTSVISNYLKELAHEDTTTLFYSVLIALVVQQSLQRDERPHPHPWQRLSLPELPGLDPLLYLLA